MELKLKRLGLYMTCGATSVENHQAVKKMDLKTEENRLVPQFVGHGLLVSPVRLRTSLSGKNGRFVWFRLLHGSLVFSPNSPNFPRSVKI